MGKVWGNLQGTWAPDHIKSTWYKVIHDIYPTNERLRAINLSSTAQCNACGNHDSILHRITDCGTGSGLWEWTRRRIAWILRTAPSYIPKEWIVRPQLDIWPPQRRRATLWILAHLIWYRLQKVILHQNKSTVTSCAGHVEKHASRQDIYVRWGNI